MAMQITKGAIDKYREMAERAMNRARGIAEKADSAVGTVVQTAEVGITAFGFGWAKGRYGSVELMGVPADLLSGLVLHGLGFVSGGKYHEHLHNLADGAIASYATTLGFQIGHNMALESAASAPATSPQTTPAAIPAGAQGDESLSDAELAALSKGSRAKARV